jgi:hypothetical protein
MDCGHCYVYFRRLVGVGVMSAILVTAFVPAMAASQAQPNDASAFSNKSIAKVVANTTSEDLVRSERSPAEAPKKAQPPRSGFFKTRTGLVVLAVMAVGTGYAVYSAKEDRIKGINR